MKYARALADAMRPHCERIEVAGSLRRGKAAVKDIELVAVPRLHAPRPALAPGSLFDTRPVEVASAPVNLLRQWATTDQARGLVQWIKPGKNPDPIPEPKSDGYWRAYVQGTEGRGEGGERMKLDLFLTTRESWGLIFMIRTGSNKFNAAWFEYINRATNYRSRGGQLVRVDGEGRVLTPVVTDTELEVFKFLGLDWVDPRDRTDHTAVKVGGRCVGRYQLQTRK